MGDSLFSGDPMFQALAQGMSNKYMNHLPISGSDDDSGKIPDLDESRVKMLATEFSRAELLAALRLQTETYNSTQSQVTTPSGSEASKGEVRLTTSQDAASPLALENVGAFTQGTTQDSEEPLAARKEALVKRFLPEEATYEFPMTPADDEGADDDDDDDAARPTAAAADEAAPPAPEEEPAVREDDDTVAEPSPEEQFVAEDEAAAAAEEDEAPAAEKKKKKGPVTKKVKTKAGKKPKAKAAKKRPAPEEEKADPATKKLKIVSGMKVHALYDDDKVYYPAKISKVNADGTVNIDYDDNSFWDNAPLKVIREVTLNKKPKKP